MQRWSLSEIGPEKSGKRLIRCLSLYRLKRLRKGIGRLMFLIVHAGTNGYRAIGMGLIVLPDASVSDQSIIPNCKSWRGAIGNHEQSYARFGGCPPDALFRTLHRPDYMTWVTKTNRLEVRQPSANLDST
nr:hypothetical protein CFP56_02781 [Quercus suber]